MGKITKTIRSISQLGELVYWIRTNAEKAVNAGPVVAILTREDEERTSGQNDKFHPMVRDIKRHYENQGLFSVLKTETHWRLWLLAQFKDQIIAPSIDGQQMVVVNRKGTSDLNKKEGSEFIEWLYATGTQEGVVWSEPALKVYEQYRESK